MKQAIERRAYVIEIPATVGQVSTFGGAQDTGVGKDEGLALWPGLARWLDPEGYYIAMRWPPVNNPADRYLPYRHVKAIVQNPKTKIAVCLRAVDWGPGLSTGRVGDLSPGGARAIGIETDEEAEFGFPDDQGQLLGPCEYSEAYHESVERARASGVSTAAGVEAPGADGADPRIDGVFEGV